MTDFDVVWYVIVKGAKFGSKVLRGRKDFILVVSDQFRH